MHELAWSTGQEWCCTHHERFIAGEPTSHYYSPQERVRSQGQHEHSQRGCGTAEIGEEYHRGLGSWKCHSNSAYQTAIAAITRPNPRMRWNIWNWKRCPWRPEILSTTRQWIVSNNDRIHNPLQIVLQSYKYSRIYYISDTWLVGCFCLRRAARRGWWGFDNQTLQEQPVFHEEFLNFGNSLFHVLACLI